MCEGSWKESEEVEVVELNSVPTPSDESHVNESQPQSNKEGDEDLDVDDVELDALLDSLDVDIDESGLEIDVDDEQIDISPQQNANLDGSIEQTSNTNNNENVEIDVDMEEGMGSILDDFINQGKVGSEDFITPDDGFFDVEVNTSQSKPKKQTIKKGSDDDFEGFSFIVALKIFYVLKNERLRLLCLNDTCDVEEKGALCIALKAMGTSERIFLRNSSDRKWLTWKAC